MADINLISLSNEQLIQLQLMVPDLTPAIADELLQRSAYGSDEEMFSDLALVLLKVEQLIATSKHTTAVKSIIDMKLTEVLSRAIATAQVQGISYSVPALNELTRNDSLET